MDDLELTFDLCFVIFVLHNRSDEDRREMTHQLIMRPLGERNRNHNSLIFSFKLSHSE